MKRKVPLIAVSLIGKFGATFLVGAALTGCERLPEAQVDAGGVTFDFAKYSDERFHLPSVGEPGNLVPADLVWHDRYNEVHHAKVKHGDPFRVAAEKCIAYAVKDGVREIHNSRELENLKGPDECLYQCVSGSWVSRLRLPDAKGGNFRVSCRYQARHHVPQLNCSYPGGVLIWFYGHDAAGKEIQTENGRYECWVFADGWGDWQVFSRTFTVAAGTDTLDLHVRLDGIGDTMFRDFSVERARPEKPLSVVLVPNGLLDKRYALPFGQAQMICYGWKKTDSNQAFEEKDFRFTLTLPKGVAYLADGSARPKTRTVETLADGSTRISFVPALEPVWHRQPGMHYTAGDKFSFLVCNTNPAPWKGEGALEVSYAGKRIADIERTEFFTVEAIKAVRPKRFKNGVIAYGTMDHFGADGDRAYAKTLVDCGVDLVISGGNTPERTAILREAGVSTVLDSSFMSDGYFLGDGRDRPADERFVASSNIAGSAWQDMVSKYSTCPLAVVDEMPYFKTKTVPQILRSVKGLDGAWTNWEPFMYKGYGCNCERCTKAFAEWKAKNPNGTVEKFRSILHGRMVRTLDKYVRQGSGGEKSWGFVAGVSWREMCSAWRDARPSVESEPIDYGADMKWIDPWGPYCYVDPTVPYNYEKRGPLAHFIAAKDIRETTDADFPLPKRPKLMSFPQGMQCGTWYTQPERMSMACDAFFFNGFEANVVYFFPEGYDARFLKAYADSTTRAAKYEDFVYDGMRKDALTRLEPVAEYARPCPVVTSYIPKCTNEPLLQQATYEKDGTRIVAVFNFWEKGEAFFTLRTLGLPAGTYEIVDEDGTRCFRGNPADGAFLMVGAARTKVFEIRKAGTGRRPTVELASDRLMRYYAHRRSALADQAAEDAKSDDKAVKTDAKAEL